MEFCVEDYLQIQSFVNNMDRIDFFEMLQSVNNCLNDIKASTVLIYSFKLQQAPLVQFCQHMILIFQQES